MNWLWRRKDRQLDLQRELQAYLDLEAEEQQQAGTPAGEARLSARRLLGNITAVQEQTREVWGWAWAECFVQDVLYGCRSSRKTPNFTILVVLTLALGIGATSGIFSIVNAVLLQPLPYKDSDRLVVTWVHPEHKTGVKSFDTYRDFEAWQTRSHSFQQLAMATWAASGKTLTGAGKAQEVLAMPVSAGFFTLLGVRPLLGRTFQKRDYHGGCAVVLRYSFWKDTFAANPAIVGKSIRLDEQNCTVLGVMPPGFTFYPDVVPLWRLTTADDEIVQNADHSPVGVFERLKPGVSRQDAQRELRAIYASVHQHDPPDRRLIPDVFPLQEEFTFLSGANLRLSLLVLFAAVIFVLLIACINVANLFLGRSLA